MAGIFCKLRVDGTEEFVAINPRQVRWVRELKRRNDNPACQISFADDDSIIVSGALDLVLGELGGTRDLVHAGQA